MQHHIYIYICALVRPCGRQADIWASGCVLIELFGGVRTLSPTRPVLTTISIWGFDYNFTNCMKRAKK